jgi:ATP-binding cassette subfamily F protein 3
VKQDIARTKEQALWVERTTTSREPGVRRIAKKVAKKAKSREKKLDRFLDSDERLAKPKPGWQMNVSFGDVRVGRDVLTLDRLSVGFAGLPPLLTELDLGLGAEARAVLTGPNGCGKTTLLRTIVGELPPQAGRIKLGASVRLGYLSQDQDRVDHYNSALEAVQAVAPQGETDARNYLHHFLFSGDDAVRPTAELSYGERARLALAVLVAEGCNVLLLDEPINHLDVPSRERFETALSQFGGSVLAVVHDRYFIERFATDLWIVEGDGIRREVLRSDRAGGL